MIEEIKQNWTETLRDYSYCRMLLSKCYSHIEAINSEESKKLIMLLDDFLSWPRTRARLEWLKENDD